MNDIENILEKFRTVLRDPSPRLSTWKEQTGRMAFGYFCCYCPEEILYAGGILPIRILGREDSIYLADQYLPAFSCSFIRSSLELGLKGKLNFLDGIMFPQTCDSIQVLSDIWRNMFPGMYHEFIGVPSVFGTADGEDYFFQELIRVKKNLEDFIHKKISPEDLTNSIKIYNKNRKMTEEIYNLKAEFPGFIKEKDLFAISLSGFLLDRSEHSQLISKLLTILKKHKKCTADKKPRILLSGNVCNTLRIANLVEESGGVVVYDDFCTGSRYFLRKTDENMEPLNALVLRYMNKIKCPCKSGGDLDRGAYLLKLRKKYRLDGIIFLNVKFCDPHYFDYPYLRDTLRTHNIPHILIDIDQTSNNIERIKVRMEAFLETMI